MEKHYSDAIVVFPGSGKERHFSELTDKQLDEISEIDVIPWSSGDVNFTQTGVFIDRFFNRMPFKDIAEKYHVQENTTVKQFHFAVKALEKIVSILDARREGMRAMKPQRFTDEQKMFLLIHVFCFTQMEVAEIFGLDHRKVSQIVKRMADKFSKNFNNQKEPVKSAYEGLSKDEIVKRITGQ